MILLVESMNIQDTNPKHNDSNRDNNVDNNNDEGCPVCHNSGYMSYSSSSSWRSSTTNMECCPFCNGTCEYAKAAASFMKAHPCQCIHSDRENCPLCGHKCHHSTNNKPKLLVISPPP